MTQKLECDLVMRGGITSGIVYPRAIAKLADSYNFRSIGGTSAGAIAAAGTAAAAYGAKHGTNHFKERFKKLPEELSDDDNGTKPTRLERLFQPQPGTRRLFRVLMSGLGRENKAAKIASIVWALWFNYWPLTLLGAMIGLGPLLLFALNSSIEGTLFGIALAAGIVSGLIFMVVLAAAGAVCDVLWRLPKNGYGMCSGSKGPEAKETDDDPPLTDWLHKFFQEVANRTYGDDPLTFGDLWGTDNDTDKRDIELVLMTTNVTRGISQRFPFLEGSWGRLFFKKEEFRKLFPESVVEHLCQSNAPKDAEEEEDRRRYEAKVDTTGFEPLPKPADLPILLGARMSLSFPFLLSAVPLYAANFEAEKTKDGKFPLEKCWFSDGGLTSNFPIHFFDAPLPSRPTFGINLVPDTVETSEVGETDQAIERVGGLGKSDTSLGDPAGKIWMPSKNATGIGSAARFNKFDGVLGFFGALFDTARNWADTELMAMPAYRDRIVHVRLAENEGGLNLNMPSTLIEGLGDRGEAAGELLATRFGPDPDRSIDLTWDNHRWVRFRSFMAAFEDVVRRLRATWEDAHKQEPWRSYEGLLSRDADDEPSSYPLERPDQFDFASAKVDELIKLFEDGTSDRTFDRGNSSKEGRSPRPKPVLRMMPPGSNDPRTERAG